MAQAHVRHILVKDEAQCQLLMQEIQNGEDFGMLAFEHSLCPSKTKGGDLGDFSQGRMVKEFDEAVFSADVGSLCGPIKTEFGYHLFEVLHRF